MITEGAIKTKLHVAACSGANATDGTEAMRPWGFDGLALERLNNPVASVERIPHSITDDDALSTWADAFVAAAALDDTEVVCKHIRWTKDGGGAFEVAPTVTTPDTIVTWQIEEWVMDANAVANISIGPEGAAPHKSTPALVNPTPVKLKRAIERTEGAAVKITNWCRAHRPNLPWLAATGSTMPATAASLSNTELALPSGRNATIATYVAEFDKAKSETAVAIKSHTGRLTSVENINADNVNMMRMMMESQRTSIARMDKQNDQIAALNTKVDSHSHKLDAIIGALQAHGLNIGQTVHAPAAQPMTQPPIAPAPDTPAVTTPPPPPMKSPWMTATTGGGRGGGAGKKRGAAGRGQGAPPAPELADGTEDGGDEFDEDEEVAIALT